MAAVSSSFQEDGTTLLTFADGRTIRIPSALLYDRLGDPIPQPAVFKNVAAVAVTAGTAVAVWTPAAGKSFRLLGWFLSLSVAGEVLFKETTGGAEFLRTPAMAAGIGLHAPPMGLGILANAANDALAIDVSASGTVNGFVFGVEE